MKKSKLSIGLVTSFIGVLALTSCGEVTGSNDSIVTIKGYDGSTIKILTDDVYGNYQSSSAGVSAYYNAILETLVRYQYQNESFMSIPSVKENVKTYKEVVSLAENKVEADKKLAETNANSNSSSYWDEWDKILDEKSCEDEAELLQYYIYQVEKEQLEDWIYESSKSSLTKEYIGLDKNYQEVTSKVDSQYPYHISHILVKLDGSSTDYIQSTISEDEVTKLYTVVSKLSDNTLKYLFSDVAKKNSEDTESAKIGGDVGIMTPSTSFVNEFKLGIYAYDAVLSGVNTQDDSNAKVYNGLGLNGEIKNSSETGKVNTLLANGDYLGEVPYVIFEKLNEYKDVTKDEKGNEVNDNASVYYPRNIIFNQYLNLHNPFVITNDSVAVGSDTWTSSLTDLGRFQDIEVNGVTKKVLCDDQGRVIIGVRGSYGIHFMIMSKSIFKNTNDRVTNPLYGTNLEQYYSTLIPSDDDFPTYDNEKMITYVNYTDSKGTKETYSSRADTIKSDVKGFDPTYDYRLYEALLASGGVSVKYQGTLEEDISNYIADQRATNTTSTEKTLNESWRTYIELLESQDETRERGAKTYQLVPTTCAVSFKKHSGADWEEGGKCYNAK